MITAGHAAKTSLIVGTAAVVSEAQYVVQAIRGVGLWRPPDSLDNLIQQRASHFQGLQRTSLRGPVIFYVGYNFVGKSAEPLHAVLPRTKQVWGSLRRNFLSIFFRRLTIRASIMSGGRRLGELPIVMRPR